MIINLLLFAASAAIISVVIKKSAPEFALLAVICAGILILIRLVLPIKDLYTQFYALISNNAVSVITEPILKIVGISALSKITAEFCKDCGESALAVKAELTGTIGCIAAALPVVEYTLDIISGMI